jgi:hypothetical protein
VATVQAEGQQSLLLILTSGDTQTQGMDFVLQSPHLESGSHVKVEHADIENGNILGFSDP